ncbi:MFS transporter [Sphingosinicellaceae bacterium]|nr:MFS transporter [Sphingosinicellaceae bacterium]
MIFVSLLATRRFGPLFATQFAGAFNDNLFKTALIFLVAFHLHADDPTAAQLLATVAGGIFTLPFLLFSGVAGAICDARDKAVVARWVKLAEIVFMALGAAALTLGSVPLGLFVIFLMGLHSTVFGPVKYAILPQHLRSDELLAGTGLVEGATFVAILLGQIAGGLLAAGNAGWLAVAVALAGATASRFIPPAPPLAVSGVSRPRIDWNPWTASRTALGGAFANRSIAVATIAISWFWAIGAIYTTQFAPLAKSVLGGSEGVATLFLAAFSVGVALGSVAVGRLLKGRVSVRLAPCAGLVMAVAGIDLYFAESAFAADAGTLMQFLARPAAWRLLADLSVLSFAGGVFSVPLYAVLQTAGEPGGRSRAIAANNIINGVFQIGGVVAIGAAVSGGVGITLALMVAGLTVVVLIPLLLRLRVSTNAAPAC